MLWVARLPDRPYPGLVAGEGQARGRLYTDLTTREWATLDAFEDPTYTLTTIKIVPGARPALAYVWPDEYLPGAWTLDDFSATDLTHYLERCEAWRQRYEQNY
ncbi:MAG: gamma-glutamylcyclotransferase [Pseudonocardiaceae bacterium]